MATTSNAAGDWFEENALNHLFGYSSVSQPTSIDIKLYSSDPGEDGSSSTELDTSNDPGYSAVTLSSLSSDGTVGTDSDGYYWAPNSDVTWTASGAWTTAPGGIALWADGSYILMHGSLDDGSGGSLSALSNGQTLTISCDGTSSSSLKFKLS